MSMTVVVTRDVEDRYRGFLLSCMHEVSPTVYVSQVLDAGSRERVWEVISQWHSALGRGSVIMIEPAADGPGIAVRSVGAIAKPIVDFDGILATLIHQAS